MVLVKELLIKGSTDFGKVKADLEDVAVRTRKVGEMSPTIKLGLDDGAASLKLQAFRLELRSLRDAGSQSGLSDLAARLKAFGNETGSTRTKMAALKLESDALKASMAGSGGETGLAGAAAESQSAFAGLAGPGIGALIGAGVALSPVLLTVGAGLGGLGIAAAGVVGPVLKASQSAKGLQGAWSKLDPLQRQAAASLITLKGDYHSFQQSLKPEILTAFSSAVQLGGQVLHDVQPVAAATGKAFGGFVGELGQTLNDPQWSSFWSFMQETAPNDVRLLGGVVINLTNDLPPLLEALQPAGNALLVIAEKAAKAAGGLEEFLVRLHQSTEQHGGTLWDKMREGFDWLQKHIPASNKTIFGTQVALGGASTAAAKLAAEQSRLDAAITVSNNRIEAQSKSLAQLTAQYTRGLQPELDYTNAELAQRDGAKNLADALQKSHDKIGLNTAAQRSSFSAANTYISDLENTAQKALASGHGIDGQIRAIRSSLPLLESAKTKNRDYWREVATLVGWLSKLEAQREDVRIHVHADGSFRISGGNTGLAGGGLVRGPGTPTSDSVLIRASRDEYMIKAASVAKYGVAMMDAINAGRFAGGGLVGGSYGDGLAGLQPWLARENAATLTAVETATARAFVRAMRAAVPPGGGGPGGDPAANLAIGRRMFPWPASMWPAQVALWNRESGWSRMAYNASSGATGIPQALPYTKMPRAAWLPFQGGQADAGAQIGWGYGYERSRYGNPLAAWAHEVSFGWYDRGGWLPPGASFALNTTGRAERVGGPATVINLTVKVGHGTSPRQAAVEIAAILNQGATAGVRLRKSILSANG
jgi:hypothetical protein